MADETILADESGAVPAVVPATGLLPAEFSWILSAGLVLLLLIAIGEFILLPPALDTLVRFLRLPLGLAYVLFVPGYCLLAALFPAQDDLDGIERSGLSLGLSVAWISLLVLILERLPWGLRLWPIAAGQLLAILIFSAVAVWRRSRLPAGQAQAPPRWRPRAWWRTLPAQEKRVYRLCAAALLLAVLALAWVFLVPSPDEFMTEFYILGAAGLAEDYPREAAPGQELMVTMGISNKERRPMAYRVEVWAVDPWSGRREVVHTAGPFSLAKGESLEQPVEWQMPWPGDDQQVEFYLFSGDEGTTEPYRQLRLWLSVADDKWMMTHE